MQISLRSQMIAGTTALVGATAIAMTPMAPAVSLPTLSTTKAAVELAALTNPINTIVATGGLAIDYLINGNYTTGLGGGAANWGSGIGTNSGITDTINGLIQLPYLAPPGPGFLPNITAIGIVPNFLDSPFPVLTQVVNNWLGYAGVVVDTGAQVLGNLSNLIWAPVGVTVAIAQAILTGQAAQIPTIIQTAIQTAIAGITGSIQAVVGGVQYIAGSIVAKAQALVTNLSTALPQIVTVLQGQVSALASSVQTAATAISTAIAGGDITNIFNTAVAQLLGPTGIPGAVLNLTMGAGVQFGTGTTAYVPSVRATIQTLGQTVKGALGTAPASASAVRSAAAVKTVAPAAAASDSSEAAGSDAAPAPAKAAAKVGRHAAR